MIAIPDDLAVVLRALARRGRPLLAGGCVRDALLGRQPTDFDIEVFDIGWDDLHAALAPWGPTDLVGRSFGVVKLRLGERQYDFSLPRRESKSGAGHRGFVVEPDPGMDEKTAAARRDFTINALLYDPFEKRILDFFRGVEDLERRILRHTSAAFPEDPLRVLRGFQFAARFDLTAVTETIELCASMLEAFHELPVERIWGEWDKFATAAARPSRGLAFLRETRWLTHFPELAALDGLSQDPVWHPEGDVYTHTGHCLDALVSLPAWKDGSAAERRVFSFAVLCHDLGKAQTTVHAERQGALRWISPGHDQAGGPLTDSFLERIGSPHDLRPVVRRLVECHHVHQSWPAEGPGPATVRRLARKLLPATIQQLLLVLTADHLGRPPLRLEKTSKRIEQLREAAHLLSVETSAPAPFLRGRDLVDAGLSPGPAFSRILRTAYEAQLDGAISTHADALEWLSKNAPSS